MANYRNRITVGLQRRSCCDSTLRVTIEKAWNEGFSGFAESLKIDQPFRMGTAGLSRRKAPIPKPSADRRFRKSGFHGELSR
jgi:hypothetical protein